MSVSRLTATGVQVLDAGGAPNARLTATGVQVLDAGGTPAARLTATGVQVLALDPDYVPIPGTVSFYWQEDNPDEDGHRVYHSTATMDPTALPAPLAELGPNVTSFDHVGEFLPNSAQHYRVSAYKGTEERVSAELVINATDGTVVGTPPSGGDEPDVDPNYARDTTTVVLRVNDDTHAATTNTKQALLDAGFLDANITVSPESEAVPDGDIILLCRAGATQAAVDPIITKWQAGTPVVWGSANAITAGTGRSVSSTFADLTGTWTAESASTNDNVIVTNGHPITEPFSVGRLGILTNLNYGIALDAGAPYVGTLLATGDENSATLADNPTLIAVEAGTNDLLGSPTPARSVVWGDLYGGQSAYNADGAELLGRIIDWSCGGI